MTGTDDKIQAAQILRQLDRYASEFDFPMLDNAYVELADMRLTAFRNASEWLIVFEDVGVFQEHTFMNTVSAYGNRVQEPGTQLGVDDIITPASDHPIWDDDGNFLLDPANFEVVINGQARRFTPSREEYERAGVDVDSDVPDAVKILRLLTFLMPDQFFLSDARLLEICGRGDSSLKRFLQLDDWRHPDIAAGELPSESVCLRNLATAIAEDDAGSYSCPEEMFNTHWSNWMSE
jgi:hypothetical protein